MIKTGKKQARPMEQKARAYGTEEKENGGEGELKSEINF